MNIMKLIRKEVRSLRPYVPGKPIEELEREKGIHRAIKMASNENALGPSPQALRALKHSFREVHRYPDSSAFYLTQKLSEHFSLSPEYFVIGNGSDELITLTLKAFVNTRDEVIIARPTFLIYEIASQIAGARLRIVPMKDFRYDLPAMKKKITKRTKLIFIANPDNPVGTYVTNDEVKSFMEGLPKHVVVFFDEAYFEFADAPDFPNVFPYLNTHPVIITRTFSKAYGLSGLRIGYGITSPVTAAILNRVREPFNTNLLAQKAAIAALDDRRHLERTVQMVREGKSYLCEFFKKLGLFYVPSATNFVLVNTGFDAAEVYDRLLKRGVIVRDMKAWNLPTFIRVTVGTWSENRRFAKALKKILKDLSKTHPSL